MPSQPAPSGFASGASAPPRVEAFAFGEILWDYLPSGRHAGGAPFNVCSHLVGLGIPAGILSAVGRDELGDELLRVADQKGVDTRFITRARPGLATGTVRAELDENQNASYDIVEPAAWDEIRLSPKSRKAVRGSRALIYGSLASRSRQNREELLSLLALTGPLKLCDVNLRPPFADPELALDLAQYANVLKLNETELVELVAWIRGGGEVANARGDDQALSGACATLAEASGVPKICITRGARGAALWEPGQLVVVKAPSTHVRDTVGAGDAFMACLVHGILHAVDPRRILQNACSMGAFVTSKFGATPPLPDELLALVRAV